MKRKAAIFLIFAALFCVSKDGMGLVFQNARWYNIIIYTVSKDIYFRLYMVKIEILTYKYSKEKRIEQTLTRDTRTAR